MTISLYQACFRYIQDSGCDLFLHWAYRGSRCAFTHFNSSWKENTPLRITCLRNSVEMRYKASSRNTSSYISSSVATKELSPSLQPWSFPYLRFSSSVWKTSVTSRNVLLVFCGFPNVMHPSTKLKHCQVGAQHFLLFDKVVFLCFIARLIYTHIH